MAAKFGPDDYHFEDVAPSRGTADAIERLWRGGWVVGVSITPPLFEPDRAMTRAEIAVLIARAADERNPEPWGGDLPADVEPGAWYVPWVGWSLDHGMQEVMPDGLFHPNDPALRSDVASLVDLLVSR